jgi:hypothetical protein
MSHPDELLKTSTISYATLPNEEVHLWPVFLILYSELPKCTVRFLFINSILSALISQSLIPFLMAYSSHDIYE